MVNGGKYTSNHDHRMVMALKVAGIASKTPITIDDEDCVGKSFPTFSSMFEELIKQ
jgi:5-enolpyruvylshikimate-3-phosphate synthase